MIKDCYMLDISYEPDNIIFKEVVRYAVVL